MADADIILSYVQNHVPLLYLEFDEDGSVREANRTALRLLGEEILGRQWNDVFINIQPDMNLKDLASHPDSLRMLDVNLSLGLPQTFHFSLHKSGENIVAIGGVDLTEQDAMRSQIISLNTELGNLTRELQKANAELKKAHSLRNQFLGIAAHDLRKPVGFILYAAQDLLEELHDKIPSDDRDTLDKICSSSKFMARLIDDFLDVASAQAGHFSIKPKQAALEPVVKTSCETSEAAAHREDVKLKVDVERNLPPLFIDEQRIEQALCNLISNAMEQTRPDTTVYVSAYREGDEVTVAVRDEGEGVPEEIRERLFQPFEQHGTYKSGGTRSVGLGLMIARRIIEAHGGRIWFETEADVGSTFGFTLPVEHRSEE